jgi:hypothetical protein
MLHSYPELGPRHNMNMRAYAHPHMMHRQNPLLMIIAQTMDQFRNFKRFIDKIDKHGMKSGIVKVIPPAEW